MAEASLNSLIASKDEAKPLLAEVGKVVKTAQEGTSRRASLIKQR